MTWPIKDCMACGKTDIPVAMVSDPFIDHCYGLCQECLSPIYKNMSLKIKEKLSNVET